MEDFGKPDFYVDAFFKCFSYPCGVFRTIEFESNGEIKKECLNIYENPENGPIPKIPTKDDLDPIAKQLEDEWEYNQFLEKRKQEYPPLEELADALYHKEAGDETFYKEYMKKVQEVKDKYPKGYKG